jgi:acyl carrier protein
VNIYIYGNIQFTNEVHKILDHGNIRFKIEDGEIEEIKSLNTLKNLLKSEPQEIYLIDENKIIEDDFISKYLKFLLPEDGIKLSFLDAHSTGDISLRQTSDIANYITKRLEAKIPKPNIEDIRTIDDIYNAFDDKRN